MTVAPIGRIAPVRCPNPSPVLGQGVCRIIPNDSAIPSRRSWPYRGVAMQGLTLA